MISAAFPIRYSLPVGSPVLSSSLVFHRSENMIAALLVVDDNNTDDGGARLTHAHTFIQRETEGTIVCAEREIRKMLYKQYQQP